MTGPDVTGDGTGMVEPGDVLVPADPSAFPGDVDVLPLEALTEAEAGYARAANTLRGYRSDWREFTRWCSPPEGWTRCRPPRRP